MKKHNAFFLALIVAIGLLACKSSSNKSVSSDNEDILKADTIPFFTTVKKMYEAKDIIAKEFGTDVKLVSLEFLKDPDEVRIFDFDVINKKADSVTPYSYTTKGKFEMYQTRAIYSSDEAKTFINLDELNFKAIPTIIKNFKEKNKCDYDSCVIGSINMTKFINMKNNNVVEFMYGIKVYEYTGGNVDGDGSYVGLQADKNGNIYDWGK